VDKISFTHLDKTGSTYCTKPLPKAAVIFERH
jgi:hypothetical protein